MGSQKRLQQESHPVHGIEGIDIIRNSHQSSIVVGLALEFQSLYEIVVCRLPIVYQIRAGNDFVAEGISCFGRGCHALPFKDVHGAAACLVP